MGCNCGENYINVDVKKKNNDKKEIRNKKDNKDNKDKKGKKEIKDKNKKYVNLYKIVS